MKTKELLPKIVRKMPKNTKGMKNSVKRNGPVVKQVEFIEPTGTARVGVVDKACGNCHFMVKFSNGSVMNCRLPGSMRRKRITSGMHVIADEDLGVGHILHVYPFEHEANLRTLGLLVREATKNEVEEAGDDDVVDFDAL